MSNTPYRPDPRYYVDDGCFGTWSFMRLGQTYTVHAFNKSAALGLVAAQLGVCGDDLNPDEFEVLTRPVSVWESEE